MFTHVQKIGQLFEKHILPLLSDGNKGIRVKYLLIPFLHSLTLIVDLLTHSQYFFFTYFSHSQAKKEEVSKYLVSLTYIFDKEEEGKEREKEKEKDTSEWQSVARRVWRGNRSDEREAEKGKARNGVVNKNIYIWSEVISKTKRYLGHLDTLALQVFSSFFNHYLFFLICCLYFLGSFFGVY
jgi:hypothetical protein